MLSFGDPSPFTGRIRDAGCKIICQVQTLAQAKEVPPIVGTIADRFGVSASFLIIGGVMLLLCTLVALIIRRIGRRGSRDESLAGATD